MSATAQARHPASPCWLAACLGMLLSPSLLGQDFDFKLATAAVDENGKIEFRTILVDHQAPTDVHEVGGNDHYQIDLGPQGGQYNSDLRLYTYDLFVKDRLHGDRWTHYEVKADPSGQFLDRVGSVNITITAGSTVEHCIARLPLHNITNEAYLLAKPNADPASIQLGKDQPIPITLLNKLTAMKLVVQSVNITYADPSLWDTKPTLQTTSQVLEAQTSVSLDNVIVRANPAKALPTTFSRFKNTEDTQLNVSVHYAAESGGNTKDVPVVVKIRFVPSFTYLFLVLILGALLGSLGRLIDEQQRKAGAWLQAFFSGCVAAMILEFVGIGLTSLNSEFKIFGMTLDPMQPPQVLLLGLLVGLMGLKIATTAQGLLPKKPTPPGVNLP